MVGGVWEMNNLDLTKPEGENEESGDQDIHKNWIIEGLRRLENKIDGIERRIRRVEYILYGIGIAIVVLWAIVGPILQTVIKFLLENYTIIPKS